jgi:hypothetical protein
MRSVASFEDTGAGADAGACVRHILWVQFGQDVRGVVSVALAASELVVAASAGSEAAERQLPDYAPAAGAV